jgi:diguanylate cyclase (GGDEF)-like protein
MERHTSGDTLTLPRIQAPPCEQDWRDLAAASADIAFETDGAGRFTFIRTGAALGWPAERLLGQPSEVLLPGGASANPFFPSFASHAFASSPQRASVQREDGRTMTLNITAAPIQDDSGQLLGARGVGFAVEGRGAMRRWDALDQVLRHLRVELLAPRMMQATLERLVNAACATGALVMDAQLLADANGEAAILHAHGPTVAAVTAAAHAALSTGQPGTVSITTPSGERLLIGPSTTRFTGSCGLVLWRSAHEAAWDEDDLKLVGTAANLIRVVLEHEAIQNEMAQQARIDPLTGLPNRRAFLDEAFRRVERLDRANVPATLMFIDIDDFRHLNDCLGQDVGDAALLATTELLRQTFRPTDIIARIGGDEFAVWLDGADTFSSAERAEALCRQAPLELNYLSSSEPILPQADIAQPIMTQVSENRALRLSIGMAMRWPGGDEDLETLMRYADQSLAAVKRAGGGSWKAYQPER